MPHLTSHTTSQAHLAGPAVRGGKAALTCGDDLASCPTSQASPCEALTSTFVTSHLAPLKGGPPSCEVAPSLGWGGR